MKLGGQIIVVFFLSLLLSSSALAQASKRSDSPTTQDFKKWEAQIKEYQQWLELVRVDNYRLWVRLDSSHRPHRWYLGEGFERADDLSREHFVETFSKVLAGHPDKFMLIDLFDGATGTQIGEFGWGGFKLYPNYKTAQRQALSLER